MNKMQKALPAAHDEYLRILWKNQAKNEVTSKLVKRHLP
jgi:hypothetical protein